MISFIIASVGRASLAKTLASIETWPGDEILVVGNMGDVVDPRVTFVPHAPGGDWGHTERNVVTPLAQGRYLVHIDDDDVYAPVARALMAEAISTTPGRPIIFRMRFPNGITLWHEPVIRCGNVGTPMMLIPNRPTMLGQWGLWDAKGKPAVGGDCAFLEGCKWEAGEFVWRSEVIALLGHN